MSQLRDFLESKEWDSPFFKRLAHNDTGRASGHQGGLVVLKDLREFFPTLDESKTSRRHPTVDRGLRVEMFLGIQQVGQAIVRYQFQTWGGKRSPESRLTDNLGPIRNEATRGDILLFQRRADSIDQFRLMLITRKTKGFGEIAKLVSERPGGALFLDNPPVTAVELQQAAAQINEIADYPFKLKQRRKRVESRRNVIARSSAFPEVVNREYEWRCCVSGLLIKSPGGPHEAQAAHVVPVTEMGTDDVRNGLSLSRSLHWAFDQGLFGIRSDRTVYLPRKVLNLALNRFLHKFDGKVIKEATTEKLRVHEDALAWHRKHRVKKWE